MPDATYDPKVYRKQGGNELVVASGGKITQEQLTAFVGQRNAIDVKTTAQIKADTAAIQERYSYGNLYGRPLLAAGSAISNTVKNLVALGLLLAALYVLTKGKELAA